MHTTNFCTIVSYQLILIIASIDRWGASNGDLPSTLNLTSMVAKTTTKSASVATKVTDNATRALLHCPLPSLSNPKPQHSWNSCYAPPIPDQVPKSCIHSNRNEWHEKCFLATDCNCPSRLVGWPCAASHFVSKDLLQRVSQTATSVHTM